MNAFMREKRIRRQGLRWGLKSALLLLAMGLAVSTACEREFTPDSPAGSAEPSFVKKATERGHIYMVTIPAHSAYRVQPAVDDQLNTLEGFVSRHAPLAAVNGGYFDPSNAKTTSYITLDGSKWLDPKHNERLTGNASLKPYLESIFNRVEFRQYRCAEGVRYDIVRHADAIPSGCTLAAAMGAGPALLPENTARQEGFVDYNPGGRLIRDPIGVGHPNARTAVGLLPDGSVVLLMVSKRLPEETAEKTAKSGFSLDDVARLLREAGAVKAMNLDGGSSSGLYFSQNFFYGKFNENGQPDKRRIKLVLMVVPESPATSAP